MVSKNDHVKTIFNSIPVIRVCATPAFDDNANVQCMVVSDERKRGLSLKIPFLSLFGMFSPNLATEKLSCRNENHQLLIAPRLELNGVGVISEIVPALCCVAEYIHLVSMASAAVLKMLLVSRRLRVIDTDVAIQILQLIAGEFLFCSNCVLLGQTFGRCSTVHSYPLGYKPKQGEFLPSHPICKLLSSSTQDTKLRKFGLLGWNHVFTLLGLNLKLSPDIGDLQRCTNGGESANVHPAFVFCLYHLGVKDLLSVSMVCKSANVHPAFAFCLYHLGVKDLLSVSLVCKSLNTTICDDSLLWKHIHICQPLNEKITEDALLRLTEGAQGTLQCLRLVDYCRITDDCLKRVLDRNPQVVKLGVPGCTRVTIDGILSILRDLKSVGKLQVKHLEIGGLFGVTKDHFDELFDLLNIDDNVSTAGKKAMQKKEDVVLADQLGRMSVSRKRSYYHLFDVSFHSFSLQEWSKHYDLIRQTIVALSGWFGSILEFLYGSLPRPPDVLYVFSPKLTILMVVQVQDARRRNRMLLYVSSLFSPKATSA